MTIGTESRSESLHTGMPGKMLLSRSLGEYGPGCGAKAAEKAGLQTRHHLAVRLRVFAKITSDILTTSPPQRDYSMFCCNDIRRDRQSLQDTTAILHEVFEYVPKGVRKLSTMAALELLLLKSLGAHSPVR